MTNIETFREMLLLDLKAPLKRGAFLGKIA
jgi:hypothetical protein